MTLLIGLYILIALGIAMFITSGADKRNEYNEYREWNNDGQ